MNPHTHIPRALSALLGCVLVCASWTSAHAQVQVTVKERGQALQGAPVLLRAARPKGPREPRDPKPAREWAGQTNAQGVATFTDVPADLAQQGLRLHAISMHKGVSFKSPVVIPSANARLGITIYEKTADLGVLSLKDWQLIVEPAEGFLIFTQNFQLQVSGDKALDTSLLTDPKYEKGLPLEMPLKAKGINAFGEGKHQVIDSTVYWQGVVKPGAPVNIQLRYSMTAYESVFVYEQAFAYPVLNPSVIAPVQTRYKKIPRLNDLELAVVGFDAEARSTFPGTNRPLEILYAAPKDAATLPAGSTVKVRLKGLPFSKPMGPWITLALALLGAVLSFGFYGVVKRRYAAHMSAKQRHDALLRESEGLYQELEALEDDLARGDISEQDYTLETMGNKERLALILKKIDELQTPV